MNRRILILGEGATELSRPGDGWTGCARVLVRRLLGCPPEECLSFDEHVLSRFRRDLDFDDEAGVRGEDAQARIGRWLAARDAHGLVLVRDNDQSARRPHGDRRTAIERGFAEAYAEGHVVPAVLALAVECIEAWALADPGAWARVFGKIPTLPKEPEALWGNWRDQSSQHPKSVLRRCFAELGYKPDGSAVAQLLEHAALDRLAEQCPLGFGRFVADLQRAFPPISCVVAASIDRAIGLDGEPPWGFEMLCDHMNNLRALVSSVDHRIAVIMGRKTWQALPALPVVAQRFDIVVTRNPQCDVPATAQRASSFDDALRIAVAARVERAYVLGGGELFREALGHFRCTEIHYTRVDGEFPGADTFFPEAGSLPPPVESSEGWGLASAPMQHHDNGFDYEIARWSRFKT